MSNRVEITVSPFGTVPVVMWERVPVNGDPDTEACCKVFQRMSDAVSFAANIRNIKSLRLIGITDATIDAIL